MKTLALLGAFLLPALLLSACVSAPATKPEVAQIAPETLGLGSTPAPALPADWWKTFHDPQVLRLSELMLRGNPTLASAMARIRAADAAIASARAQDYPQITLDGEEQRTLLSKNYIIPPPFGGTERWLGQVEGNLNWSLDFWGKQADMIAKARDTAQAARLDAAAAQLALSGAFAQAYLDLLLAYQNSDIADQTVRERQDILNLTQSLYDAGIENAASVEQARALLSLARIDQLRFAAAREIQVHAIAALTGQGAAAYGTITRPTASLDAVLPLPTALPADLLARRPDVLAARARVDAAAAGREAAHAAFYPDINLAALVGFQAIGLSNLFAGNSFTYGAGPAIHLPIFDAGKIRADYAGATANLDSAVSDYNNTVLGAVRQTADAITQTDSLARQRPQEQAALDSATRAFALAESRYKAGLSDQLPVLNAENTLLQTRQQMAALAADTVIQRVTLLLSLGGGLPLNAAPESATQDKTP